MAYLPCRCSVTLLCPVCISVFRTPLALSVLLSFMLSAPYPFSASFLYYPFLLLCFASLHTPQFSSTVTPFCPFFFFAFLSSLLSLCMQYLQCLCMLTPRQIPHNSSALSDDHRDSSASLVVQPMCLSSLGVMSRFLFLSGS
jgi:hypothetical protein